MATAPPLWANRTDWTTFQFDALHSADNAQDVIRLPLQPAWSVPVAPGAWDFSSALISGESVFIGTINGALVALDRRSGRELWRYTAAGSLHSAPIVASGKVVFGSADGRVVAVDVASGQEIWSLPIGSNLHAAPNVSSGTVYLAANDGGAYAIDLNSGSVLWRTELGNYVLSSPALGGSAVFFAALDGRVMALDRGTGAALWTANVPAETRGSPSFSNGLVYVGGHDGVLRALNGANGTPSWSAALTGPVFNGLAVSTFAVYAASLDGKVTALDKNTGAMLWRYDTQAAVHAAPTIIGSVLVIGSESKTLFFLDSGSGRLVSQLSLSGRAAAAAPASRGRVFVLTDDGSMQSFLSPNQPPLPPQALAVNGQVNPAINTSSAIFSWLFADPDSPDAQSSFRLDVASASAGLSAPFLDTGVLESTTSAFSLNGPLADGFYSWQVQTYDLFGDSGPFSTGTFVADRTAPLITLGAPLGGERFVAAISTINVAFSVTDNLDLAPRSQAFLVELQNQGAPRGNLPTRVAVSSGSQIAPLSIDNGIWQLQVTATDWVGNSTSTVSGPFTVIHDILPPRTTLAISTPQAASAGYTYITRRTILNLNSIDDLVTVNDDIGLGVSSQTLLVDGVVRSTFSLANTGPGTVLSSSFTLTTDPDGLHLIDYFASDVLNNTESVRVATVAVDNTPPSTQMAATGGRLAPGSAGASFYSSSFTSFGFSATDPLVNGVASGIGTTQWQDNGGTFLTFTSSFTLPEGAHHIGYQSQDRVQNFEVLRSTTVLVDSTPPISTATVGSPLHVAADGTQYITPVTYVAFSANDPVSSGVASGVDHIELSIDSAAYAAYVSTLTFPEGRHTVLFRAVDRVGNVETANALLLQSDATPPVTTVAIGSPTYAAADGTTYVTPATSITFAARDPNLATGQAGSGVNRIEVALDGGTYAPYTAVLRLPEGRHVILYRAVDNVSNVEAYHTLAVQSDATPPLASLAVSTPSVNGFVSAATLFSLSAVDPVVNGVVSGVAFSRYRVNGGAFAAAPLAFHLAGPDGAYQVDYQSQDNVANLEVLRSTVVFLDRTPPVSTLHIGAPGYVAFDGTQYVPPTTPITFTAVDPSSAEASGVKHIEVALDGGAFTVYTATLTFAEGRHSILYRAVDNVGNVEATKTLNLQSDATPPITAFETGGTYFKVDAPEGTRLYASHAFAYSLPATDPVVNNVASGMAFTRYRAGPLTNFASGAPTYAPGAFTNYISTFGLTEGIRRVDFQSQDNVGNLELLKSATVFVDATPPVTALSIGVPQYAVGGTLYVSTVTPFSLASKDPMVQEVASGVSGVFFHLDAAAFAAYSSTFTIPAPDGARPVNWYAADNVGNLEAVKTSTVALDATPPLTSLAVAGGRQFPGPDGQTFYASADARLALHAVDPIGGGGASGVALTQWRDNGGSFQAFSAPFSLGEGAHRVDYRSQDNVANVETIRSTNVWVDSTPPVTTASIGAPTYTAPDGTIYVTPVTSISFAAADPALPTGQSGSGVNRIEVSLDGNPFAAYVSALTFPEGRHTVAYRSVDNVGNVEAARTLALQSDVTPPVTVLAVSTPSFNGFVSAATLFSLSAVDPAVNGVASGVAFTRYRVNSSAFGTSPLAFRLTGADGAYQVDYQSQDNVTNLEVLRSTAVFLDQTPPATTPHIGAPSYVALDGTQYVTPATPVTFTAIDLSSGALASGVNHIEVALDGGAFTVYTATQTFAEGRHSILYRAVDYVGNVEATKTLNLQSDATPPITSFKTGGTYYTTNAPEGMRLYAPLAFSYSLPATDPIVNNVASGLAFTRYRSGQVTNYTGGAPTYASGAFAIYNSTFGWAEGIRRVDFQSQDNVGNLELLKSATVFVDATPPVTELIIGAPQYAAGGTLYVSTATHFTLASQDPVVQEVASGVSGIFSHLDANPFAAYTAAFTIPVPDGIRTASFYAADNVGNVETVKTSSMALDATPPQTSLLVTSGHQFPGPNIVTFYTSADTRFSLPAADPIVNSAASGLAWTRWQDNGGTFSAYLSTLSFAEGAHALGYQSQDNVLNLEVLRSTNVWVDATPPVTTVAIGSSTYTAADGTIYVTPATPITFAASDPNLPSGQAGSGVNRIDVSLDGGAYAPYMAALKLAEGRHVILYRAVDNVANVEAYHTLAVQSDATPPVSSLVIGLPQYQLPNVLLVSSRTPIAVAAVDPVSNNVASGVKDSWYNVNDVAPSTGAFQQYLSSFILSGADVNKAVQFYSRDNVLNTEVVKSSTVLLDSTPPEISLLSPAVCDSGICRVLKGKFPVLGSARDLHFASYVLDFAPGLNATAGYVLIGSGAVAVSSGTLGTWDASTLSGWQTLRLTAADLVANVTVLTVNVYVGDPTTLMLLGNHATFDMPTGVAVGADGKIYVADRDNDRVAVFTSTGGLAAVFGGRHDEHRDDDEVSTTTLRLRQPAGVAVDASGNVYVADTGHHRVLELSPSGRVLLDLGRRKVERDDGRTKTESASGKAPGEFRHPLGVAVDAAGSIYVADTGNGRVQVFTSTGGFERQFALPALPAGAAGDDGEAGEKDDDAPALGRPAGIAVDAAGNVYLADLPGRRALRYDPSGALTLTIPITGDEPGRTGRPYGVAVSTSGECLLVSDMQSARVLKFDRNGVLNLGFGVRARGDDEHGKAKPAGIALRKPAGLALDASGNLYVVDRNAEKVEKFGLPDGRATVVVPPPGPGDDDTARDVVSREDGGKVERADKAAVDIPAQAVSDDLKVSVSSPSADVAAASARGARDGEFKTASPPVDFGPEGTKFAKPVTLTLPYSPDLVARQDGDESSLKVHYWNKEKSRWEELDTKVDPVARTVTAKTSHFSLYQVFAASGASSAAPLAVGDPTFVLHDVYAFPNPVHSGAATIRVQPGLADSVSVRVYDVSGRKVHESSDFTLDSGLDDGNGKGPQYTYDHVWNVSGVGSGVYVYVITAKKAGKSDIHKTGRIGVSK